MNTATQTITTLPATMVAPIAANIAANIQKHCLKAEIAGQLRRNRPLVSAIRLVAIPMSMEWQVDLFSMGQVRMPGFVEYLSNFIHRAGNPKTDTELRYFIQHHSLPTADHLFPLIVDVAHEKNYGYKLARATGPHELIITAQESLRRKNIILKADHLFYSLVTGKCIPITSEEQYFDLAGMKYRHPHHRY